MCKLSILYLTLFVNIYFWIQPTLSLVKINNITDVQRHHNTWNMVQALGKTYNAKVWILHCSPTHDISWKTFWHRIVKEAKDIGYFGTNVLSSSQYMERPKVSSEVIMNLYVNADVKFLQKQTIDTLNLFHSKSSNDSVESRDNLHLNVWMIKMPDKANNKIIANILNETMVNYDSNVFCYTFMKDNIIDIYEVYKIVNHESSTVINKLGTWSALFGLQLLDPDIWSRRVSLGGHRLKVASAYSPPAVTYIEDNCNNPKCFKGIFADVWHALAAKMNLTYTIKRAYKWGSFINGSWNGMVGMIQQGIADIAVTDLTLTKERSSAVDFLPSVMETNDELFINHPGDSLSLDAYIAPFSSNSWVGVILWIGIFPIILAALVLYGDDQYSNELELGQCYGFVAQVFMMRSSTTMPNKTSNRIAFGSVLLGGILIYYNWEAELFSHLAVRKTNLPFKNLNELTKDSRYKVLVGKGSIHVDVFKYSNDPDKKIIWKEKIEPYVDELPLYEDLVKTVLNHRYSVIYAESGIRQHQAYINCTIIDIGTPVQTSQLAWAVEKRSHFYGTFRYHLTKLKEIGAVHRYYKTYEIQHQLCPDYSGNPLSVKQCITAFNVLITGVLLCLLWLLLEILTPRKWMKWLLTIGHNSFKKAFIQKRIEHLATEIFDLKQRRRKSY